MRKNIALRFERTPEVSARLYDRFFHTFLKTVWLLNIPRVAIVTSCNWTTVGGSTAVVRYANQNIILTPTVKCAVITCRLVGERAKRARHYQGCTNSSWCGTYIYIYICMEVRMSY